LCLLFAGAKVTSVATNFKQSLIKRRRDRKCGSFNLLKLFKIQTRLFPRKSRRLQTTQSCFFLSFDILLNSYRTNLLSAVHVSVCCNSVILKDILKNE
jgi:hypothetical protein